jgi:hypothetical protein
MDDVVDDVFDGMARVVDGIDGEYIVVIAAAVFNPLLSQVSPSLGDCGVWTKGAIRTDRRPTSPHFSSLSTYSPLSYRYIATQTP